MGSFGAAILAEGVGAEIPTKDLAGSPSLKIAFGSATGDHRRSRWSNMIVALRCITSPRIASHHVKSHRNETRLAAHGGTQLQLDTPAFERSACANEEPRPKPGFWCDYFGSNDWIRT
ncbi:hypothetical protein [Lysobacter capsici]|uniref:hypothetical protein n=1 Tax=Lysobacter capsici TaxID=435897 RepID=UPI0012FD6487|nr:hypothetical protein [Lysobacter capsici]